MDLIGNAIIWAVNAIMLVLIETAVIFIAGFCAWFLINCVKYIKEWDE